MLNIGILWIYSFSFSPPPEEKTYDIVFAGNLNTYFQRDRASWLTRLARLSHKYKVKIDTCVFGHEYTKLLQSAKIVFNRSIRGEANMRVFEALAADALILLEEENQEIQSYFKNNNECILYNNQNFEAIIDSLLQNPNKLTEIIQNASAHKHICTKHYSLHELKNIIGKHIQNSNWKQRQSIQYTSQQHIDATLIARILSTHRFSKKEDDPTAIKELLATTPNSPLLLWYYALLAAKVPDNEKQAFYKISLNTYYSQCEFLSTTCLFWTHFNFLLILQRLNFCPDRRLQLLKTLHQLLDTNSTTLFSQDISLPACISEEPFMMEINYYSWPLHEAPFANDFGVSLSGILMHWVTFNLGKEYLMQDQLQLAERYFGRANNYFSNNSECQFLLAYTQNQQKKWPSAQIHIQNAWELDPLNHHYWPLLKKLMSSTNSDNWNNQNTIFALLQEVSKKMWQ
jgi:tetratricopeptide (TPR) repeat protein